MAATPTNTVRENIANIDTNGVQAITGGVMNLALTDLANNDWFVDSSGDRYLLPAGTHGIAVVGSTAQVFVDQLDSTLSVVGETSTLSVPTFGVQGVSAFNGSIRATWGDEPTPGHMLLNTTAADSEIFGLMSSSPGADSYYVGSIWQDVGAVSTNQVGVVKFPGTTRPITAFGAQRNIGVVGPGSADNAFLFAGNALSSDGRSLVLEDAGLIGLATSVVNETTNNYAGVYFSEMGLALDGGYLSLRPDPNPNNYVLGGGEIRFITSPPSFQGYTGSEWVDFGVDVVKTVKYTLSAAELLTIGTVPVEVVPAPGADKIIQVLGVYSKYNFNTTNYILGGAYLVTRFTNDALATGVSYGASSDTLIISSPAYIYSFWSHGQHSGELTVVNQGISIQTDDASNPGDLAVGDGTLDVYVTYKVITV